MFFWKNLSARTLIVLINQISILIAIPIVASRLGIENFGSLSVAMIFFQVAFMLTEWGFGVPAIKESSEAKEKKTLGLMFIEVNLIKGFILSLLFIVLILIQKINLSFFDNYALFYGLIFAITAAAFNPLWFFQAIEQPEKLVLPSIIGRVLYLSIIFFLVSGADSMHWVLTAQGVAYALTASWGLYFVVPFIKNMPKLKLNNIKKRFLKTTPFFLSGAIMGQFHSIWGLFLIAVAGPIEVAIFNLADQALRAGNAFTNILPEVLLVRHLNEGEATNNSGRIKLAIFTLVILSFIGLFITEKVILIFFGSSYLLSVSVIQVTIIIWLLLAIIKLLGYPLLGIKFGLERVNKFNYIFFALNIIGIILWINAGNFTALFLAYFVLTICFIYLMLQIFLFKSNWITGKINL